MTSVTAHPPSPLSPEFRADTGARNSGPGLAHSPQNENHINEITRACLASSQAEKVIVLRWLSKMRDKLLRRYCVSRTVIAFGDGPESALTLGLPGTRRKPGGRGSAPDGRHGPNRRPADLPHLSVMRITVLAGGVGAARFLVGLKRAAPEAEITVIGNTGDDITLFGLRVCPDLDTVMYTLGDGINTEQGWGRAGETFSIRAELAAYGASPDWFTLGDRDFATHLLRRQLLAAGQPLSGVTELLCRRWQPGVRLLPMSDDPVETHVVLQGPGERRGVHFQAWWV